ncbi:NAC domain-containing protein 89-like [Triticum dicoccoides]|uniref:NAC domain-containing protein 89-like n=2 Tax=Triticum dicoccoides TaxID=85692 RepID=UPI00188E4949|nr:NAC domain-containing protein 89-like [Triticum dicoccoides]XP_037472452.1 NAC domain-containing protein 89-like [Triticum dicoccoides]
MAYVTVPAATAEMDGAFSHLRPGFRFHPTDQELVSFYLRRKVLGHGGCFIPEVDLYKLQPHHLPGKSFSPSTSDPGAKVEWYLFAPRGRKYPTGLRMERATPRGFWKSTGKDRPVMHKGIVVDMKKTLVFHIGKAPSGTRTDLVMHEYRLHGHHIQDTYALCRVFNKNMASPSTNASGDVDTDEDLMQFVPGVINIGKDRMEYVCGDADSGQDPKHFMLGGVKMDKVMMEYGSCSTSPNMDLNKFMLGGGDSVQDVMQSMLDGIGTGKDPIQVQAEPDGASMENDFMQSVLGGVGTDMDPIHVVSESDAANANKDLMQFAFGALGTYQNPIQIESEVDGVDTDEGEKQFLTDGDDTGNGEMQILADRANKDQEAMQPMTGGTSVDGDNSGHSWFTNYLAEENNSWTQSPFDDFLYTSDDMGMIP